MSGEDGIRRTPTGIEGLDAVLNGGLLQGAAYIVQGPPGAGKTILANQICFNHSGRGEVALYVSLLAESHDRMIRYMQALGFYAQDRIPDRLSYISAYSTLEKEGMRGVIRLLGQEARRRRASLVVLDGLFVIHDVAGSELEFRSFVHELQGQAALLGLTMVVLTNQRRGPDSPEFTMVDGWIELSDVTHGLRAARQLTLHKQRGGSFMRGSHFFRITQNGIVVFPRTESAYRLEREGASPEGRMSSGVAGFDRMLGGGFPAASATLLYGPSGSGKTTMGLHFLAESTEEEPGLLFGLFESPERLIGKAKALGLDFERLIARNALGIVWRSPAENIADELAHELIAAVKHWKARRVFVDGLGPFRSALLHPERFALVINAINRHLRALGTTLVWTLENREFFLANNIGHDDLSQMVDGVILLHYAVEDDVLKRRFSILKVRDSDFDPRARDFIVTDRGIRVDAVGGTPPRRSEEEHGRETPPSPHGAEAR
ncbi:ATPase domain-containing protein [Prosthecomicrobium pneumaticum]|uniref:non-specific serine/threonine protein kinase n=1 Tax=Prosthecomicrobium pneumaticum TaxID=81895 RepID=A0A7W9FNK6_9HYPH|nr:circadian clock protein KaiC [Prosthecomicrobium pneumaticum]